MLMACRNGHLEVVEYLYERCDADIEQAGSGIFLLKINRAKVSDRLPSISIPLLILSSVPFKCSLRFML